MVLVSYRFHTGFILVSYPFGLRNDGPWELAAGGDFLLTFVLYYRAAVPGSCPREVTSRIHSFCGSDNPCNLATGGDFSYTFVLRGR